MDSGKSRNVSFLVMGKRNAQQDFEAAQMNLGKSVGVFLQKYGKLMDELNVKMAGIPRVEKKKPRLKRVKKEKIDQSKTDELVDLTQLE